jgi:polar amino acid transport system ATP-binding protein
VAAEAVVAGASAPIVAVQGLKKRFGTNEVLKGIDLQVARGEVVAIIGKSGSGKSTLLRCINGLEEFQEGSLQVDSQPLKYGDSTAMRALRQRVGMIFQSFNLFPHLDVGHNVMLAPGLVKGVKGAPAEERARQLLARVGLAEKFSAYPDQLSGGQQQRVAIARALAMDPAVLLCDEITSALDPELVDPAHGDARDELRPQGRRPRGLHARRPHPRDGATGRTVRRAEDGGAAAVFVSAALTRMRWSA